ncbi:MAG: Holliday junction branch migration protein RuvA [Microbacteriaceae bacterium]
MISSVRGTVLRLTDQAVVVEVGGLGLSVLITPRHARRLRLGSEAVILTTLLVREDSLTLYGFESAEEADVFELLLGVGGVGPKSALGVISELSAEQIAGAVAREDDAAFRAVSGIGPKTAKLIIVSLAGRLTAIGPVEASMSADRALVDQVRDALIGLGWSERVAVDAVAHAVSGATDAERSSVPALLRITLAQLGPQGGGAR